jgi:hypothetical protein
MEWRMAIKLQLERHSERYTDLLDAANPMVTSDWPYLRWLCSNSQNHPNFRGFLTEWRMAVKLQLERHSGRYTDLLDAGNPMVTPDWLCIRWLCCYGQNQPQFPCFFNRIMNGCKLQLERRATGWLDLFDIRNPMVLSCLPYLCQFSRYSQNIVGHECNQK